VDLKEREELLVSGIMIIHAERDCWSELLSSNDVGRLPAVARSRIGNVSNPAQNPEPYSVIVNFAETRRNQRRVGQGGIDGTVSSFSPSAAGVRTGFSWNAPGDL